MAPGESMLPDVANLASVKGFGGDEKEGDWGSFIATRTMTPVPFDSEPSRSHRPR